LTLLEIEAHVLNEKNWRLEKLVGAEVGTIAPWNPLNKNPSWSLGVRVERPKDVGCDTCLVGQIRGSGGFATRLGRGVQSPLVFGLLTGAFEAGRRLHRGYRVGPGFELGTLVRLGNRWKLWASGELIQYWPAPSTTEGRVLKALGEATYSVSQRFELRATSEWTKSKSHSEDTHLLGVGLYY
jgi:hypothetical protein